MVPGPPRSIQLRGSTVLVMSLMSCSSRVCGAVLVMVVPLPSAANGEPVGVPVGVPAVVEYGPGMGWGVGT